MNPVLDLLNRLFLANPTQALEEVKHLLVQKERDINYWRDKHARADQDLSAAQYDAAETIDTLRGDNADLILKVAALEEHVAVLNSASIELTRQLRDLGN